MLTVGVNASIAYLNVFIQLRVLYDPWIVVEGCIYQVVNATALPLISLNITINTEGEHPLELNRHSQSTN